MPAKRKICVVLTDKAQLGRLLTLLQALKRSRYFTLQIVVGAAALTYRYGNVLTELRRSGFTPNASIASVIDGGNHLGMAKTAALTMLEFASAFDRLHSDIVVVRGDRFEMLPIAAAAAYLNKLVVHLEGGEKTGSIDESVRHAITKLAHLHFVSNADAKERVIRLGENKNNVFNVGSLDVDFITKISLAKHIDHTLLNQTGTGANINLNQEYIMVIQNPVTTEEFSARKQINETLSAVSALKMQAIWIWPNLDAGSEVMAKRIREWQNTHFGRHNIKFVRYLPPAYFINILNHARALIGNSSAGIKECAWLGVPVVNIGSRQAGRLRSANVLDVDYSHTAIAAAIRQQIAHSRFPRSDIYGHGSTGQTIEKTLRHLDPPRQKTCAF